MTEQIDYELRQECRWTLSYHQPENPREIFIRLANHPLAGDVADYFGKGIALQQLESPTADLPRLMIGSAPSPDVRLGIYANT